MLTTDTPLTCVPSRVDPRDWIFEPDDEALAAPPAAVDLRDAAGAFPPPWDQGALNSCTAQAMAAALHYDARRQDPDTDFEPSRLFIYYVERKDEGTLGADAVHGRPVQMRDCIEAVAGAGACGEAAWPYQASNLDAAPPAAAYTEAAERRAASYHRLQQDLGHLKACLAQGFPFLFGLRVYASFPAYGSRGQGTVPLPTAADRLLGGHALLAVGYDDARGGFIVRNSWGPDWGDGGYCVIPYGYLTDPSLAFDHWVVNALAAAAVPAGEMASAASAGDTAVAEAPASTPPTEAPPPAAAATTIPAMAIYPSAADEGAGSATPPPQVVTLSPAWPEPWSNPYGTLQAPYVAAGDRLVGVANGYLFAVDLYHGTEVKAASGAAGYPYEYLSALDNPPRIAASGGLVYLADGNDPALRLLALRVADGVPAPRWKPPAQQFGRVRAILTPPGAVVVVSLDAHGATQVAGFDAATGAARFGPLTLAAAVCGPVGCGADAVYFVSGAALHAVNVDYGDPRWKAPFTPAGAGALDPAQPPRVGNGVVLAATLGVAATQGAAGQAARVFGVDLATGQANWSLAPTTAMQQVEWLCAVDETGATGVAASSAGEVVAFAVADGTVAWRATVAAKPGAPTVSEGVVSLVTDAGTRLTRLDLATGAVEALYALPGLASGAAPLVANATVLVPDANGGLAAHAFGAQSAAYFDGSAAYVDVPPDGAQFDFGTGDFTVEAWVRSSQGGEVVSSYPTSGRAGDCGFRLNLTADGDVRVAVLDPVKETANKGRTGTTHAADGEWHHLALLRRSGSFVVLVDGSSYPLFLPSVLAGTSTVASASAPLSLGGTAHLAIGASVGKAGMAPTDFFRGLIREVRIWNRALDVATIQTNARVELTGCEPRLLGLWPLDEVQAANATVQPRNAVVGHRAPATFHGAASFPTDLVMDDSAFPYLLHEAQEQWPYAGTWAARGEHAAVPGLAPAVYGGTVVFNADTAVYGLRESDGGKLWEMEVGAGASAPVAGAGVFYLLTGEDGVVAIDPVSGSWSQVPAFSTLLQDDVGPFAAPAVSAGYLAAASPGGTVRVMDLGTGAAVNATVAGGAPQSLVFGTFGLAVLSGTGPRWTLSVISPASGAVTWSAAADAPAFCAAGAWLACIRAGAVVRVDPAAAPSAAPLATSAVLVAGTATITGLAANPDADLVVATTSAGTVFGLSLATLAQRWSRIPAAGTAAGFPAFDAAGRVFCAVGAAVAVIDPSGGTLLGWHDGENPITTPLVLDAASAYFSRADPASETAATDGALHSLIFGETTALRLNLDVHGAPVATTSACAQVDAETGASLALLDVTQSCVEAWVNLPPPPAGAARQPGGGILAVCPTVDASVAPETGWGLSLSVGADGSLAYRALTDEGGAWTQLDASAPAGLCDGRWHHVAVSRGNPASPLVFYVDGAALPAVQPTVTSISAPATVAGVKAFVGAVADASNQPAQPFCGMIAEVRVWDTYLVSTDVATRMHVKLLGSEPDLLAYWSFDRMAVHDAALQGHDGALAGVGGDPVWWLTDLPFTTPAYPWVESAAKITQLGAAGETGELADTLYALTLRAHRADGSPLAGHPLDLSYVIHGAGDPASVTIAGTEVTGLVLGREAQAPAGAVTSTTVTTGPNGAVTVPVATKVLDHGPAIDVHAGFMPANERFHVSVLIDNQVLAKPAPPTLTAQAKLIQDYGYTTGNSVDDSRDRTTWRVVLRAANADQSARPGEMVTLWASEIAILEVAGQPCFVTPENSVTLAADGTGEVTVVLDAGGITAPTLYARAAFMHRDDQVVVKPDQDAQGQLGTVQAGDLSAPKLTNWKPNATATDQQSVLTGEYANHADDIASSVRTVMTSASGGGGSAGGSAVGLGLGLGLGLGDGAPAGFDALRQPAAPAGGDRVALLRTVRRAPRRMPANPDAFHQALGGHVGLVFDTSGGTLRCQLLATHDDVQAERAGLPSVTASTALGGFWSDLWGDVEDVADDVYDAAEKIVVSIDQSIQVAITILKNDVKSIVDAVVSTVEEAVDAVVGFFKQLAIDIEKVIQFLREMFDWGAILATHNIIRDTVTACATRVKADVSALTAAIDSAAGQIAAGLALQLPELDGGSVTDAAAAAPPSPALDSANSVKGKSMRQKAQDNPPSGSAPAATADPPAPSVEDDVMAALRSVVDLAPDALTTAPGDLLKQLQAIFTTLEASALQSVATELSSGARQLADAAPAIVGLLDQTLEIPFISALYKWITGNDLSLLDVFALLLAIPVNMAYVVASAATGETREFSDVAAGLPGRLSGTSLGMDGDEDDEGSPPASDPGQDLWSMEILYVVSQGVFALVNAYTDYLYIGILKAPDKTLPLLKSNRGFWKVVKGLSGFVATLVLAYDINQRVRQRVAYAVGSGPSPMYLDHFEVVNWLAGGCGMLANVVSMGSGFVSMFGNTDAAQAAAPSGSSLDDLELGWQVLVAVGMTGYIVYQFGWQYGTNGGLDDLSPPDPDVAQEVRLMRWRDISFALTRVLGFLYSTRSKKIPIEVYYGSGIVRFAANAAGVVLHGFAVWNTNEKFGA